MQLLQGAQSYGAGEPAVYQESAVPPLEEPAVYQESKEENTTQEPWVEGGAEQFVDDQNIGDCLEKNLDLEGHGEFEHQESVAQLLVEPIVYEEYMEERNQEPRVDDNDWLVQLLDVEEEARQNDLIIDDVEEARQDDPIIDEARQNSTSNVEETRQDDPIIDNDQFQTGEGSMIVAEPEVAAPIGNIDRFETKNSGVMLVVEPEVEFAFQN
ncbi:hypothetical protein M5689_020280 [Euphorbia peplus]|nr:hypothetical protein M5689_020280 [Euphorbia peplus]